MFFKKKKKSSGAEVGQFYDENNHKFVQVYGDLIQAFRTNDPKDLLQMEFDSMGLTDGMKVLDAGCGVGFPAIFFASKANIEIDAVSVSKVQVNEARKKVDESNLAKKVKVHHADYHDLNNHLEKGTYDLVYFLESFGHSSNKEKLLSSVNEMLKPGGSVYIKDLFRKVGSDEKMQKRIDKEIDKINEAYRYEVADLNEFLNICRSMGFIVEFLQAFDIPLDKFENLSISNEFQVLTGIGKIEDWDSYVFPVDFFELKLMKPNVDLEANTGRYYLQSLFNKLGQNDN